MAIILGIKGSEWAWQHRKFESIDQFKAVQKAWAIWGLVLFLICIVLTVIMMVSMTVWGVKTAGNAAIDAVNNVNTNSIEVPTDTSVE